MSSRVISHACLSFVPLLTATCLLSALLHLNVCDKGPQACHVVNSTVISVFLYLSAQQNGYSDTPLVLKCSCLLSPEASQTPCFLPSSFLAAFISSSIWPINVAIYLHSALGPLFFSWNLEPKWFHYRKIKSFFSRASQCGLRFICKSTSKHKYLISNHKCFKGKI